MREQIRTFATPYGPLAIDTVADAKMAAIFEQGDYHQRDTVELLSALVTASDIFVDGGAHIGTIAIPLAQKVAQTIAYEADAHTCALLRQNVAHNHAAVDIREKGIGATTSRGSIVSVSKGNAGAHTLSVGEGQIPIVALDDDLERFDVLKLDVEGMELAVLQGAERIVCEARPRILFEVNLSQLRSHAASMWALDLFFCARDYKLYLPFRLHNELVLGRVSKLSLVAGILYPGAYFFFRISSVFDILAVPCEKDVPLRIVSAWQTLRHVAQMNVRDKVRRLRRLRI